MNKPSSIEEKFGARHKSIWIFEGDGQEAITPPPNIIFIFEYGMVNKFDQAVQYFLNTRIFRVCD